MVKGGKRKGSTGLKAVAGATAKLQEDAWAQCDNPNCQKWRRLPPGTVIDENTPWYCYMNPDEGKAACEAPEESYNYDVEVDWDAVAFDEPKAKRSKSKGGSRARNLNRASSDWSDSPRSNLGSSSQNRKRSMDMYDDPYEPKRSRHASRDDLHGSGEYQPDADRPEALGSAGGSDLAGASSGGVRHSTRPKRPPSLPLKEESPPPSSNRAQGSFRQPQGHHRPSSKAAQAAALRPTQKARKQHKGFEKLLSLGGLWEIVKGKGKAVTPAPFWVWEGLATHTPAAAELAAHAADVASAAKYFEGSQYPAGPVQAAEAAALKRQAMTAAAVLGLDVTSRIPDVIAPIPSRSSAAKPPQPAAQTLLPPPSNAQPSAQQAQQHTGQNPAQHSAQPLVQAQFQSQALAQSQAHGQQQSTADPLQQQQPQSASHPYSSLPQGLSQGLQPGATVTSLPQQAQSAQQGVLLSQSQPAPPPPAYSQAQLLSLVMPRLQATSQAQQSSSQPPIDLHTSRPLFHMALQSLAQSASQQAQQGSAQLATHSQAGTQLLSSGQDQQSGLQHNAQAQAPPQHPFSFLNLLQHQSGPAESHSPQISQPLGQRPGHSQAAAPSPAVQSQPLSSQGTAGLMQLIQQQSHAKQPNAAASAQSHVVPSSSVSGPLGATKNEVHLNGINRHSQ